MARPIKETPTLYGEDAVRFAFAVEHPKELSQQEIEAMALSHQRMSTIKNFTF